ncbi:putative F-box domain, FBD domain, leucine-rich repeat domain superfamily [Helianthus annuus]|uniref:F-box domain, FBD domain, leucine-rich repeat domain superfamily n=1 Tax=Helianthus annuus TaxID=4232 RepID=A0A251VNC5_HELAN|nr:F-box/FBD/LRR-repeat protein At1g16930 [Helianthus annuus]KAF5820752.1 putative F-box domain, FBD domain, leucine-rich repeat domain superfamily [Helianthus annuus]KAJ0610519.1 putative F-box domain, FBD domain, leucine-rich repeat domain superfamily [Helianthus annuus]KAJ0621232.1 putative F-box domain, FBD domain, leucine-rich repeat domain superfamily [Helianthus annuus]KAJ0625762.1 putative F-box domain, FBD domain, leucine-rich repeat domain superfamily [Helianthus annuus]KAJ0782133.1 
MDRISRLPDDVICHILSFLPTKHAVATSILSSRWVNLWSFLTIIDLDDTLYLNPSLRRSSSYSLLFVNFLDRVLSQNQSQTIVKFRLHIHDSHGQTLSRINGFIQSVVLRNVVEIDLGIFFNFPNNDDCLKIPNSQSLKVLKVTSEDGLKMPAFPGCFPRLTVFDVKVSLIASGDDLITNLFPCLPALEKLSLVGDLTDCTGEIYVNVGGVALKRLELELSIDNYDDCDAMVVIDAPRLEYLRLQDGFMASYLVKNKPAISEVRLDVGEYDEEFLEFLDEVGHIRLPRFNELLQGLVNSKFISVSASTLKVVCSQRWNLPVLPSLTKLELDVHTSTWMLLLYWLESCPNLMVLSLILKEKPVDDLDMLEELELTGQDVVPLCLSSRVKEIEIKRLGRVDEEEMLKYLLENAKVLDKFTVNSRVYIKDGILQ